MAQLVERLDSRFKDPRFEPRQEHKKNVSFSESKMFCWLVGLPNLCVYASTRMITYARYSDPAVHVKVRWISETQKDPGMHLYDWIARKVPVVHVRVRWFTETRKYPACTYRTGWRCSYDCCSLAQIRRSESPERDNKVGGFFLLKQKSINY